jgi:hypothetical protein
MVVFIDGMVVVVVVIVVAVGGLFVGMREDESSSGLKFYVEIFAAGAKNRTKPSRNKVYRTTHLLFFKENYLKTRIMRRETLKDYIEMPKCANYNTPAAANEQKKTLPLVTIFI